MHCSNTKVNWSEVHNHKTQMHMRQLKQSTHANTTVRTIPEMFKHIKDRRTKQTRWSGQHNKMLCSHTAQSEARKHAIKCNENAQWLLNSNSTREACMTCEHSAKLCSMHAFMQCGVCCPTLCSANPQGKKSNHSHQKLCIQRPHHGPSVCPSSLSKNHQQQIPRCTARNRCAWRQLSLTLSKTKYSNKLTTSRRSLHERPQCLTAAIVPTLLIHSLFARICQRSVHLVWVDLDEEVGLRLERARIPDPEGSKLR